MEHPMKENKCSSTILVPPMLVESDTILRRFVYTGTFDGKPNGKRYGNLSRIGPTPPTYDTDLHLTDSVLLVSSTNLQQPQSKHACKGD
ncbi:hypothetical protein Tco_1214937 [Tanacetum coccineum]